MRVPFSFFLTAAVLVAGCSGGGPSNPVPVPTPTPAATAPVVSQSPFAASANNVALGNTLTYPAAGGYAAQVALGAATIPAGTTATLSTQSAAPTNAAPMSRIRAAQPQSALASAVLVYLSFTPSNTVTATDTYTVTVPAGVQPANTTLWLALYDPLRPSLGWQTGFAGPAVASGSSITFSAPAYTYVGGQTYSVSVYAISSGGATPSPAPSISPLPSPSGGSTPTPSPSPTPTAGGVVIVQ